MDSSTIEHFNAVTAVAAAGGMMDDMGTTTLMSFAEFELLDAGADDVELLRGELIRMPPPPRRHMEICERLFELLKAALGRRRRANSEAGIGRCHLNYAQLERSERRFRSAEAA